MAKQVEEDDDDYMGDLSLFLPPNRESSNKSKLEKKSKLEPSKKKPKTLKFDRARTQHEEDEKTLANMTSAIPQTNIGFKMLTQMGYKPGSSLGKTGWLGEVEPVGLVEIKRSRAGIGREDPVKEKVRREIEKVEKEKVEMESLREEFEGRKKVEWKSRRVWGSYWKAKASLEQLEGKEVVVVPPKKKEDGEEEVEEEEEEVVITEEDLLEILMKLRNEHRYCFFCGCQYETMEALLSNCPGTDEDDH